MTIARSGQWPARSAPNQAAAPLSFPEISPSDDNRTQPDILLGPEPQLNIIYLPKADRLDALTGTIVASITYFEHWQEETRMNQITHPPVDLLRHGHVAAAQASFHMGHGNVQPPGHDGTSQCRIQFAHHQYQT